MTPLKKLSLTFSLVALSLTFVTPVCAQTAAQKSQPPPGWQRYELDGDGDQINVLLPAKPEDFGVAKLRRPSGEPLSTRVYMLSADAKIYFALFVDLPKPTAEMSDRERGDLFYGIWNGLAAQTSRVLEEKFGTPFPITPSDQKVGPAPGGERRMQDFKVGTESGRAQVVFFGQRAYMVVAIWNNKPGSEEDALRFLNSFQIHRNQQ
jgi:hypothetical protein